MKKYITIVITTFWVLLSVAQNTTTYQYDNHNRLSSSMDDNTSIQYSFDQLGNRLQYNLTSQAPSQADLLVENISIPGNTLDQGASLLVSCDVSNTGIANAGGSYLKVYLSNTATGTDTELKSNYVSTVVAGGSESLSFNITIPQNAGTGNKYLVFFADATTVISEPNESNNKANVAVTIQASTSPDLTIQNQLINPTSLLAGASTYVSANMMNTGNENAGSFWLRCYLSLNPTFESYNDTELTDAAYNFTSLNTGATTAYGRNVNIPSNTVPGTYYLLFVADPENTISEQNEENNIVNSTLTVTTQGGGSAPVSNFSVDNQFIGAGTTVQFTDISSNNPTSWQWSFPGGTPNYSTVQSPSVTYGTDGVFDVSLTSSNSSGSNTLTQSDFISVGQTPVYDWIWSNTVGIDINDLTTDLNGNIVVVGGDASTMYYAKYNPDGTVIWSNTVSNCRGRALDVYINGDIIVVGEFSNTVNFGNNITLSNTYSAGSDGYIAKFDSNGLCLWANKIYNADAWNNPNSRYVAILDVCVDNSGNSYITGYYEGLYGGSDWNYLHFPNNIYVHNEDNSDNLIVAKFSPTGTTLWVKQGEEYNSSGSIRGCSIDTDGTKVGLTGNFSSTVRFYGSVSITRTASGLYDIFFIELSTSNGYLTTFNQYGSNSTSTHSWDGEYGYDIKYTTNSKKYVSGMFSGTANFGGINRTSAGYADAFLMKLHSSGTVDWVVTGGSPQLDCLNDISVTPSGDVFIVGQHSQGYVMDGVSVDNYGTFIGKYSSSGDPFSIKNVSPSFYYNYNVNGGGIEAVSESELYFGFETTLAKYGNEGNVLSPELQCPNTQICIGDSTFITAPAGYTNYTWSNAETTSTIVVKVGGDYYVEVSDNQGNIGTSDTISVSILNYPTATITAVGSTTFCEGSYVEFNANTGAGLTYRWLKDGEYITGATSDTCLAYINGDYQVEVSNQGECSVLSNTITLISEPVYAYVSITATETNISSGTEVTFTATPINEGNSPQYQWQINGNNVGTNSTTFVSNTLSDGDEISCVLTSSGTCILNNPALSNTIIMIVDQLLPNFVLQNATVSSGVTECYNATSTVIIAGSGTTVDINSGGEATIIAGEKIIFEPGFNAYPGSYVNAYITTSSDYCASLGGITSILDLQNITLNDGQAECYNATDTIIVAGLGTTVDINSGGEATFIAGKNIQFEPGFSAHSGSYVQAFITTTGEYCNQQQSMMANSVNTSNNGTKALTVESTFDNSDGQDISIYPNPTTGRTTIDFMGKETKADIQLLNFQGNQVHKVACDNQDKVGLDISSLPTGMYIIVIKTQTQFVTKKIIKVR